MKTIEREIYGQLKISKKTISSLKQTIKETENKANTWKENRHQIDAAITLACNNFTDEGITNDMFEESKVFRLGEITENLLKKFVDLES